MILRKNFFITQYKDQIIVQWKDYYLHMEVKMIIGASGTGKSEFICKKISKEAEQNKNKRYFIIVPDQFTMQTQMDMVMYSSGKGIMNIDVLSFSRLAHRIFEETNVAGKVVLDDTGKSLVLRKLVSDISDEVPYLAGNLRRNGFIHEVKSSISEFMQYGIGDNELQELIKYSSGKGALKAKLTDLSVLYKRFKEYIGENYITTEETMDLLAEQLYNSKIIKDSVVVLDGFTGFTPVQMKVLGSLVKLCETVYITLTLDADKTGVADREQDMFSFTAKSYQTIRKMADECGATFTEELKMRTNYRFAGKPDLEYLERNIFRVKRDAGSQGFDPMITAPERIHMYKASDIQTEARHVADKIRELVAGGEQYRNIAVVTGNMDSYENHIRREFAQYDIPVYIDKTHAIVLNPFVEFTKSLLLMIRKNFEADSVCRFLRTGIGSFDRDEVDVFENYCAKTGLRGRKKYEEFSNTKKERLSRKDKPLSERQIEELEKAEAVITRLLEVVEPLLSAGIGPAKDKKVSEYVEALYNCYLKIDAYSGLKIFEQHFHDMGDFTKEKEYSQIYRLTMELLEQLHGLLGDEKISLEEFIDILEAGFEEITVGVIPQSVDRVIVGDIERSRLKPVKYLFFMGINDGNIPKKGGKTSILSDMEREFLAQNNLNLELSPTPHQKMFVQRFYLYCNLVKPSEGLYLSYAEMDNDGKSLRESYLVSAISRLFNNMEPVAVKNNMGLEDIGNIEMLKEYICNLIRKHGEIGLKRDSEDYRNLLKAMDVLLELDNGYSELLELFINNSFYRYEDKKLDGVIAGILYGETLLASVSRMEKFAECAYAYFLNYGLSLNEKELYEIDNRDMGTIFHAVLEAYGEELKRDGRSWLDVPPKEAQEIIDREMLRFCEDNKEILFENSANKYIFKRMSKVMYKAVDTMTHQLKTGKYLVDGYEVKFSSHQVLDEINVALDVQEKMELNGKIDRIDTLDCTDQMYVKIVDYKTGDKDFSLAHFYNGLQLQLVVYLSEAIKETQRKNKDKEILPGAILYYHLADNTIDGGKEISEEQINAKIRENLRTKGLINADAVNVRGLTGDIEGKSDVVPVKFKKDGTPDANSSVISSENMNLLQEFARYKLRNIGDDIIAGKITKNPVKEKEDKTSCTYCAFSKVCGFEERLEGYDMRPLWGAKAEDEELIEQMKQDMENE